MSEKIWISYSPGLSSKENELAKELDLMGSADAFLVMYLDPFCKTFTEKDYYNFYDINRVEKNTLLIIDFLTSIKYKVPHLVAVTDRNNTSVDLISSINRLETNIEAIKNVFITPLGYQGRKTWDKDKGFSYIDANRLENNLQLIYDLIIQVKDSFKYCGTFSCGEEGDIY